MKTTLALALLSCLCIAVRAETLFFEKETPKGSTRVVLSIEGDQVYGSQFWQPTGDVHGARGTLTGTIKEGGLITALYAYTIEGSDQSEEVAYKLDGDTLYVGEGELVEGEAGLMKLKNPDKVTFEKALKRVNLASPAAGTPERKAVMEAMRGPVAAHIGVPVEFTGDLHTHGGWARFSGNVATKDGKAPANEGAAFQLELDFFALLKMDAAGVWQVMSWGFSGDIGAREEAAQKFPDAPWVLLY